MVGTPSQVADGLETWIKEADVDGFNFVSLPWIVDRADYQAYALFPQSFKDIIELLLPELQRRGLFWDDYAVPKGTYRENFYLRQGQKGPLDDHIASSYRWKAGMEHKIPE